MKTTLLLFALASVCHAQDRAFIKNDTLYYQSEKFFLDQPLKLTYGSKTDKGFAFVYMGSGLGGMFPMASNWSKQDLIVTKIIQKGTKLWLKTKAVGVSMAGSSVFIDIEGAIDNKEIQLKNSSVL